MINRKTVWNIPFFGVLLLCGSGMASASSLLSASPVNNSPETVAPNNTTETVQSLASVQSQIPVLQAQLEVAKLKKAIADVISGKKAGSDKPSNPYGSAFPQSSIPSIMPPVQQVGTSTASHISNLPRVLSISGAQGRYQATLALPNGGVLPVFTGNRVGHWVIQHIGPQGVLASHKGKTPVLLMMSGGYTAQQGGTSSGNPVGPSSPPPFSPPNGAPPSNLMVPPPGMIPNPQEGH
ncbi:type IV pilus biogenesis protein PilP [Acidithiobacillus albertensis]|uniref:type IV pilus biogenesis protein PilP n=1 Tax=Acidithiobacillus albertensis TaxID=119978 RepID=UPI001C06C056|nr:type IV pilus biogenesis protein PilP [Acidithiobacillus albertensis]MBU2742282.1 type IV pilus biogenesis protein PilP [Acidithiobacillus albertensis]